MSPETSTLSGLRCADTGSMGGRLLSVGAAQPPTIRTGAELGMPFGREAEWIEARTGIRMIPRLTPADSIVELSVAAARQALDGSGLAADDIDLVIGCTCSIRIPGSDLHAEVIRRLTPRAAGFTLNAACSGFCYAVATADSMIRNGAARHVLLVAAETMSTIIDPADLATNIIFGDGAGAAVVGIADSADHVGPVVWGSDGGQSDLISFPDGDEFMRMQGQSVFRWAVAEMAQVAKDACSRAGVDPADIEVFVPHQANLRIVKAIAEKIGLTDSVVIADDITISGNTSAASIPIALRRMADDDRTRPGQLALLVGFGAGLAWAAQVVRLP